MKQTIYLILCFLTGFTSGFIIENIIPAILVSTIIILFIICPIFYKDNNIYTIIKNLKL